MNTQEIKDLSNAVASLDIECGELILAPESAEEHALNSHIAETLRLKVAAITSMIKAMSTGVDIAPQVLPPPPAEIYLPLHAAEFIALVREGKVRAETPDGDTSRVQVDRAGDGWATRIGWDYELYDVTGDYEAFHESMTIDSDTQLKRCDDQVTINGQTFTLTQEP